MAKERVEVSMSSFTSKGEVFAAILPDGLVKVSSLSVFLSLCAGLKHFCMLYMHKPIGAELNLLDIQFGIWLCFLKEICLYLNNRMFYLCIRLLSNDKTIGACFIVLNLLLTYPQKLDLLQSFVPS